MLDGYDLISLSYHAPHQPFHNPPPSLHTFSLPLVGERRQAQAALQAVDTELARLTPLALALGYTVIIYSDNGLAGTLGGLKGTVYEGGVRTMLWAIGPGVLPGVDNSLIEVVDLYATVLEILGVSQGPMDGPDSESFAPLLQGAGSPPLVVVAQRGGPSGVDPHTQNHLWRAWPEKTATSSLSIRMSCVPGCLIFGMTRKSRQTSCSPAPSPPRRLWPMAC